MDKVMMRGPGNQLGLRDVLGHIASLQARLRQHEHDAKTSRLANGGKTWLLLMRRCHGGSRVRSTLLVLLWPALTTTLLKLMLRLPGSCLNTGKGFGISALLLVLLLSLGSSPCLRTFNSFLFVIGGRPSEQELRAIAAFIACDSKGSCGPDGWQGVELSWLALEIWECFLLLTKGWLASGSVPFQMCESRMLCFAKPGTPGLSPFYPPGGGFGAVLGPVGPFVLGCVLMSPGSLLLLTPPPLGRLWSSCLSICPRTVTS